MSTSPQTPQTADEADRAVETLMRLLGILRRRWLVLGVTTVVAVAGAVVVLSIMQPRWRASATVVLHVSGPQVLDKVKGVTDDAEGRLLAYQEYYQTQREIIGSRVVAKRALGSLGLAQDPIFLGIDGVRSEPERLALAAKIDPVERLRELTSVGEVRNSRVLKISADYPDPEIAAQIANKVADAYLEYIQETRERTGKSAKKNVRSERQKALKELQQAEQAMADFKQHHGITSISLAERQNEITQAIIATSTHLKDAEAEHYAAQSAYDEAKRLHKQGSLASATLLPTNERKLFEDMRSEQLEAERELERLSVRYGDKMPDVQQAKKRLDLINKRIDREQAELLKSLKAAANTSRDTKQRLAASLAREKDKALELTMLERDYRELEREAKTSGEAYALVARRDTEIDMTNRVEAEGIEILDRATSPRKPIYPPKPLFMAIAVLAGLSLGTLLALGIDVRDHRIRSLADLERAIAGFGLPVLGTLPLVPQDARLGSGNIRAQRRHRDLHAYLYPQSMMAERCRGIRTALTFAQGQTKHQVLMVTSPSSSEGKSSTAVNLATSFCQAGKKVVLVDADMRRPRLHQVFPAPIDHEDRGLSGLLQGELTIEQATHLSGEESPENLWVLPCGAIPENPAELLDHPNCRKVLAQLREKFDVVLVDSPPILPVTDPLILARQVDGVIVVARYQATTRNALQEALSKLRQGDTNILGMILNELDARGSGYSGYNVEYYAYRTREGEASS